MCVCALSNQYKCAVFAIHTHTDTRTHTTIRYTGKYQWYLWRPYLARCLLFLGTAPAPAPATILLMHTHHTRSTGLNCFSLFTPVDWQYTYAAQGYIYIVSVPSLFDFGEVETSFSSHGTTNTNECCKIPYTHDRQQQQQRRQRRQRRRRRQRRANREQSAQTPRAAATRDRERN